MSLEKCVLDLKLTELSLNEFYFIVHSKGSGCVAHADFEFGKGLAGLNSCASFIATLEAELPKVKAELFKELNRLKVEGGF